MPIRQSGGRFSPLGIIVASDDTGSGISGILPEEKMYERGCGRYAA